MTKTELLAPGSPAAIKLLELKADINRLYEAFDISYARAVEGFSIALTNAILAGQQLNKAKSVVPHGQFMEWISTACPKISYDKAAQFMKLAREAPNIQIDKATSFRHALAMCTESKKVSSPKENHAWPPYLEGVRKFSRVVGFTSKHPIKEWPEEGRDELRNQLQPIVQALWPEKFTTEADPVTVEA